MVSSSIVRSSALVILSFAATVYSQTTCTLTVPANPLTATGLATPYQVSGCNQVDFANQGSFVEATIFDPATNSLSVYHPLVVNAGSTAGKQFITPVPATVPAGSTVGIYFGCNAGALKLAGTGAAQCVNAFEGSLLGQFAHCNGDVLMQTMQAAVANGGLTVPPLGNAVNGNNVGMCPSTRDFRVVDMDQSDNVDTTYLLINNQVLAQNTPANAKNNTNAQELTNGSDNALINDFIAPALGCNVFMVPSVTAPTGMTPSLPLNELQAGANPSNPVALVPLNDDFTVINNNGNVTQSLGKTNLYRAGVGQTQAATVADASGTTYCKNYAASGIFIANNMALFQGKTSPAPAMANNLYTFLAQRFSVSFGPVPALGCTTIFGIANPVTLTMNGNCIVTAATINTNILQQILNGQIQPKGAGTASATGKAAGATGTTGTTGTKGGKGGNAGGAANTNAVASPTQIAPDAQASMFGNGKHWKRMQTNNMERRFLTDVKRRDAAAAAYQAGFIEK